MEATIAFCKEQLGVGMDAEKQLLFSIYIHPQPDFEGGLITYCRIEIAQNTSLEIPRRGPLSKALTQFTFVKMFAVGVLQNMSQVRLECSVGSSISSKMLRLTCVI
jgi:hypothetical protein